MIRCLLKIKEWIKRSYQWISVALLNPLRSNSKHNLCCRLIALLIIAITPLFSFSQKLNTTLSKKGIQIGEPVILTLTMSSDLLFDTIFYKSHDSYFPAKTSSTLPDELNQDYELELLAEFKDTFYAENNQYIWEGQYLLTAWDSAFVIVPPEKIQINDSIYYFPPDLLEVSSPITNPNQAIYDIHESFTEIESLSPYLGFIKKYMIGLIFIFIIFCGLFVYFFYKRSKGKRVPIDIRLMTLQKIDALEKSKGYEKNLKEYYYELSIILRKYLADFYREPIMDKTTLEINKILSKKGLGQSVVSLTHQLLTQSDMVKFARSAPNFDEIQKVTNSARIVVNEITDFNYE